MLFAISPKMPANYSASSSYALWWCPTPYIDSSLDQGTYSAHWEVGPRDTYGSLESARGCSLLLHLGPSHHVEPWLSCWMLTVSGPSSTSSPRPAAVSPQTREGGHPGSPSEEMTFQLTTDAEQTHSQACRQRGELNSVVLNH